jgi:nucleotide-binding universal stress UspA family protein
MSIDPKTTISVQKDIVECNVQSIFHPSDFTKASEVAFAHALKLALVAQSDLNILHCAKDAQSVDWEDFPGVRDMLIRWKLVPEDAARKAVAKLGIRVRKVVSNAMGPVESCVKFMEMNPADIVVLATHQKAGKMSWLQSSVSEPIARKAGDAATLFIPHGVDGFISLEDSSVSLKNILIPIDRELHPRAALTVAARMATVLQIKNDLTFTLVYVGEEGDRPAISAPEKEGWQWNTVVKKGDVVDSIVETAKDTKADLVVMSTAGRDGFLDALRGSTTERVMREINCPLLAIPADRYIPQMSKG